MRLPDAEDCVLIYRQRAVWWTVKYKLLPYFVQTTLFHLDNRRWPPTQPNWVEADWCEGAVEFVTDRERLTLNPGK